MAVTRPPPCYTPQIVGVTIHNSVGKDIRSIMQLQIKYRILQWSALLYPLYTPQHSLSHILHNTPSDPSHTACTPGTPHSFPHILHNTQSDPSPSAGNWLHLYMYSPTSCTTTCVIPPHCMNTGCILVHLFSHILHNPLHDLSHTPCTPVTPLNHSPTFCTTTV